MPHVSRSQLIPHGQLKHGQTCYVCVKTYQRDSYKISWSYDYSKPIYYLVDCTKHKFRYEPLRYFHDRGWHKGSCRTYTRHRGVIQQQRNAISQHCLDYEDETTDFMFCDRRAVKHGDKSMYRKHCRTPSQNWKSYKKKAQWDK